MKQIIVVCEDGDDNCPHEEWIYVNDWMETLRSAEAGNNFSRVHYFTRVCLKCGRIEIVSKKISPVVASGKWKKWLTMAEYYSHLSFLNLNKRLALASFLLFL